VSVIPNPTEFISHEDTKALRFLSANSLCLRVFV
jgi:hypothetical protein